VTLSIVLLRLFYASIKEASLKPLTRAHRTIQHFSKNTPRTKRTMSCHRSLPCLKDIKAPGEIHRSLYRDGQRRILPWNPPAASAHFQNRTTKDAVPNGRRI